MAKKQETQKEPELTEEQKKEFIEKNAKAALDTLNSNIWNYATPKFVTKEQYGALADSAEDFYTQGISETPSQIVYERLFLPQLQQEGGAITSPYLQSTSAKIIQEDLFRIKVNDAAKLAGYKGDISGEIKDKYMTEIDPQISALVSGAVIQYYADTQVQKILASRQSALTGGLEKLLGPKEEEKGENKPKKS